MILAVAAFLGVALLGLIVTQQNNAGSKTVYVAAQDIPARTNITSAMIKTQSVPTNAVEPNVVTNSGEAVGQAAAVNITAGQQLTTNVLFNGSSLTQPAVSAYLPIPKGWVAKAISTGELQGVAGYIQPGDYINVIVAVNQSVFNTPAHPTNKSANISKTVFSGVRVIEVGPAAAGKASSSTGVTSSLTIILTECDAEYWDWLQNNTKVTYTILSYKDYGPAPSQPVAACPPTTSTGVGPDQVDARFHFTAV